MYNQTSWWSGFENLKQLTENVLKGCSKMPGTYMVIAKAWAGDGFQTDFLYSNYYESKFQISPKSSSKNIIHY